LIVSLFFKHYKIHKVFQEHSLNIATLSGEILLLLMKISILSFIIFVPYFETDMYIVIFGWILIAPAVINQMIQNVYSVYTTISNRKKISRALRNIFCRKKKIRRIRKRRMEFPLESYHRSKYDLSMATDNSEAPIKSHILSIGDSIPTQLKFETWTLYNNLLLLFHLWYVIQLFVQQFNLIIFMKKNILLCNFKNLNKENVYWINKEIVFIFKLKAQNSEWFNIVYQ